MICLDLYRECITESAYEKFHDAKRKKQSNSYGISIERTVKFNNSGFSLKNPHDFKFLELELYTSIKSLKNLY